MGLTPGSRLGAYEIVGLIGAGGMGEVYRARDTRLDRTVAIKILPDSLAADPQFRERFDREARAISQLTHPHICVLHDVGHKDGIDFLVMEHLEGETLEQRLNKGALPINQALQYAIQTADALDKAHRSGIVHRDLKPGNIMLTKGGAKLLDFGLAKSATSVGAVSGLSMLPTTPPGLTAQGTILGTFQYMAPEQLEGKEADHRTDLFAFGAVLYEMLAGKKAFESKSEAGLIAAVLEHQPKPLSAVRPGLPPALEHVVATCLAKDSDQRWQNAGDLMRQLNWVASSAGQLAGPVGERASGRTQRLLTMGMAAVAIVAILASVVLYTSPRDRQSQRTDVVRFTVPTPGGNVSGLALSPDGRQLAFVTGLAPASQLWIRRLDSVEARPLAGTGDARLDPFWSPDGHFLAFFTATELKVIDPNGGGPPRTICRVDCGANGFGGTWNSNDVIVFGRVAGGLLQVPAGGGEPRPLTMLEEDRGDVAHQFPQFLPDGERFVYLAVARAGEPAMIRVGSLRPEAPSRALMRADRLARYAASGYLLFGRDRALMAQPFDTGSLALTGEPTRIADNLTASTQVTGWLGFSISLQGSLTYLTGDSALSQLQWIDRSGAPVGRAGDPADYQNPVLSPDANQIAFQRSGDIWITDASGGRPRKLTSEPTVEDHPIWSPAGDRIAFDAPIDRGRALYQKDTIGARPAERLWESAFMILPFGWSADGLSISFSEVHPERSYDLWLLPLTGDRKAVGFRQTTAYEAAGVLSPNGRWMAYHVDDQGRPQVWVQGVTPGGGEWQVSTSGGSRARWRRDGKELYFVSPTNELMVVAIDTSGSAIDFAPPKRLFQVPFRQVPIQRNVFDVTADGSRFLVNTIVDGGAAGSIHWVLNWWSDLPGAAR